jgi:glycosyltransferase involved in cell wall biosynthesis
MVPAVTICIPTLSGERLPYLREAVTCARAQTREDVEVIISSDAGPPEIERYAREQERIDPRVRYRRNDRRLGLGGNWNAVAQDARGRFLVIIGDDDRLLPHFVETLLAAGGPETSVLFSNHYVIDSGGDRCEDLTRETAAVYARDRLGPGPVADPVSCVWRNSVPMLASLTRTADVKRMGIKADLNTPEIELFARLAAEGREFVFVPEYLAEYRVHAQSETTAGLATERLVKYLDPIQVPPHAEGVKAHYMGLLLVSAVNRALHDGDVALAREAMRHRYYPTLRRQPSVVTAHRIIAALSPEMATHAHAFATGAKQRLSRAVRGR